MESMFSLAGRRAIVTGASRGIGQALAVGLARQGADVLAVARSVRVNALAPGYVETAMTAPGLVLDEYAAMVRRKTPMGRWAQPEEMVGAVVYMASQASSFMTGQVLVVDGGWTAQ